MNTKSLQGKGNWDFFWSGNRYLTFWCRKYSFHSETFTNFFFSLQDQKNKQHLGSFTPLYLNQTSNDNIKKSTKQNCHHNLLQQAGNLCKMCTSHLPLCHDPWAKFWNKVNSGNWTVYTHSEKYCMQKGHLTLWFPTSVLRVVIQLKTFQLPAAHHQPSNRPYYLYTSADSAVFYFGSWFKSVCVP